MINLAFDTQSILPVPTTVHSPQLFCTPTDLVYILVSFITSGPQISIKHAAFIAKADFQ